MPIEFTRIDDRLIHAQTILGWAAFIKPDLIIVASNEAARDDLRKRILLAAGSTLSINAPDIEIQTLDNSVLILKKEKKRSILIISNPEDAVFLIEKGVDIKKISVGWMSYNYGKKKIFDTVYANEEDIEAFKRLIKLGTCLSYQATLSDNKTNIDENIMNYHLRSKKKSLKCRKGL